MNQKLGGLDGDVELYEKLDINALAARYQANADEKILSILNDRFGRLCWRWFLWAENQLHGKQSAKELRDQVVLKVLGDCLRCHDPSREAGFKTYASRAIRNELNRIVKSSYAAKRYFGKEKSLYGPVPGREGELIDFIEDISLPGPEDSAIEGQIRVFTRQAVEAVMAIALTAKDREVLKIFLSSDTKTEVGGKIGISRERVRQVIEKVQLVIKNVFGTEIESSEELVEARIVVFRYFFPELSYLGEEAFKIFESIGIRFSNTSPYVRINGADLEKFNITIFKLEDGTYISGYDILQERRGESVSDLFIGDKIDPVKMDLAKTTTGTVTSAPKNIDRETAIAILRRKENLDTFQAMFAAYINDDGVWHISTRQADFLTSWIKLPNGRTLTGAYMLSQFNLPINKIGRDELCKIVFGEIQTVCNPNPTFVRNSPTVIGKKKVLQALRSPENIAIFKELGLEFESNKCHFKVKVGDFKYANFKINGVETRGLYLLEGFALEETQAGLIELVKLVFSEYKVIVWRNPGNGKSLEMPDELDIMRQLKSEENKKVLLSFAKLRINGKYTIDFPCRTSTGTPFTINGKKVGMISVCNSLRIPYTREAVRQLYKDIFDDLIIDNIPPEEVISELKKPENQLVLGSCFTRCEGEIVLSQSVRRITGVPFNIDGESVGIQSVMASLGLRCNDTDFKELLGSLF